MLWSETNIILAIIGMIGLFGTAVTWQRANRITARYYVQGRSHCSQSRGSRTQPVSSQELAP